MADAKKDESTKPVIVEFLKGHSVYNKGEIAGFPEAKADWLIEKKIAKIHKAK